LTNTFLPVRFNPAWAGIQIIYTAKIQKEDIGELEEMEHLLYQNYQYTAI
jgi:hypothetical protein